MQKEEEKNKREIERRIESDRKGKKERESYFKFKNKPSCHIIYFQGKITNNIFHDQDLLVILKLK